MSNVLVIVSNSTLQRITLSAFNQMGYTTSAVNSSAAAISMLQNSYNLIYVGLNDTESIEFVKEIRSKRIMTPVLIGLKDGSSINVIAAKQAGADSYIVIPFSGDTLRSTIDKMSI